MTDVITARAQETVTVSLDRTEFRRQILPMPDHRIPFARLGNDQPIEPGNIVVANVGATLRHLTVTIDPYMNRSISSWARWQVDLRMPMIDWAIEAQGRASVALGAGQRAAIGLWFDIRMEDGVVPGDFAFDIIVHEVDPQVAPPRRLHTLKEWSCT